MMIFLSFILHLSPDNRREKERVREREIYLITCSFWKGKINNDLFKLSVFRVRGRWQMVFCFVFGFLFFWVSFYRLADLYLFSILFHWSLSFWSSNCPIPGHWQPLLTQQCISGSPCTLTQNQPFLEKVLISSSENNG